MSKFAMRVVVSGRVQGVGFRDWTRRQALSLGLTGSAANRPDGTVEVRAEGSREACESLLDLLGGVATPGSVADVVVEWLDATGATGFVTR